MKKSAAAGLGLAAAGQSSRRIYPDESSPFNRVVYRELGSTGYKVSELGFGCMNTRESDLIRVAMDAGVNYLDTAHYYMNGVNEETIGTIMKTRRDEVFLSTKVGLGKNPGDVPGEIATSLKRLQTDHVDLLQFHKLEIREQALDETYIRLFEDARTKGQAKHIGITTHSNQAEVVNAVVDGGFWEAILVGYNYFSPEDLTAAIGRAREAGIAIIVMKSLITTVRPRKPFPDVRGDNAGSINNQQALLKWVLDNPSVDTIVPGMTSFEQLEDDLAIMGMKLGFEDRSILRRYGEGVRGRYCCGVSGCTGCTEQCPKGVDVKELNRCVNYATGYGDMELARENYRALPRTNRVDVCGDCGECAVKCVNGLDLTGSIGKARELFG